MSILSWIIVGLIGGILGKFIHPGNDSNGIFRTIILGIIGGIVGNLIATLKRFGRTHLLVVERASATVPRRVRGVVDQAA